MEPAPTERRGHFFLTLALGVVLGVGGAILVRHWVGPYLWAPFGTGGPLEGQVLDKALESDRLLLKIETEHGVSLATFTQRQAEIDLLVDPGDTVTLDVREYRPFLEDPSVARVRKPEAPIEPEEPPVDTGIEEEEQGTTEPQGVALPAAPRETEASG